MVVTFFLELPQFIVTSSLVDATVFLETIPEAMHGVLEPNENPFVL